MPGDHVHTADEPDADPAHTGSDVHKLESQRREKRKKVEDLGLRAYGGRLDDIVSLATARASFDEAADEAFKADSSTDNRPVVRVAGRVMLHRDTGKLIFMNLRDQSGDLQIAVSKRDCEETGFALAKLTDLSDLVVAEGPLVRTRTGEITIWASRVWPGSKSLVPPPEKWAGLQDVELRYRQRYVDMWANPETAQTFRLRSKLLASMRRHLDSKGFLEVETPMLQTLAGGAAARPFRTHMNALSIDLFLRIAPELYLKRLLVGGMSAVYEINRNFRNEGLDKQHNPEFSSLEVYWAYADYISMLELTEGLIRDLAGVAAVECGDEGNLVRPFGDLQIDYAAPFERVRYADLFESSLGFPMTDIDRVWEEAEKRGITARYLRHLQTEGRGKGLTSPRGHVDDWIVINELFEEVAEPSIDPSRPTFVLDYPSALSPLTRPHKDNPDLAERWDLFIAGMEIGPAYTELNDPDIQEAKFRAQLAGIDDEESTFRTFDADFVHALKVGMPPAGGLGLGFDRLVMLLTNQRSIRDVILFPLMRPLADEPRPHA